jgi:hypothetical protein
VVHPEFIISQPKEEIIMDVSQFIYDMSLEKNHDKARHFVEALSQPTDAQANDALINFFNVRYKKEDYGATQNDIDEMVKTRAQLAAAMPIPLY